MHILNLVADTTRRMTNALTKRPSPHQHNKPIQLCIKSVAEQEGKRYKCKVVRLMDFGAFLELPNGFQTLLHISEIAPTRGEGLHLRHQSLVFAHLAGQMHPHVQGQRYQHVCGKRLSKDSDI